MDYEVLVGRAEFLSHLKGFGREIQELEYRVDPLTNRVAVLCRGRSAYVMKHFRTEEELIRRLASSSKVDCPFCPGAVEERTPKFPPDIAPEGRLRKGDCWAFPSLYAHADFNAIVVLGREHFRWPSEMDEGLLHDGFSLALEVLRRAFRARPELRFATITMGYLPTGGSSLLHPHLQVLAMPRPFNALAEILSKSYEYRLARSRNFWARLVEEEAEEGSRLLGHMGRTWWLAPFAPARRYEVWGIVEDGPGLLGLEDRDVRDLADGVSRVLRAYGALGITAFNLAFFSGPLGQDCSSFFWPQVRLCARFGLRGSGLSDFWALSVLLDTDEVFEAPEEYVAKFKPYFRRS